MKVLFYAKAIKGAGQRLLRVIETLLPNDMLEIYNSIDGLSRRFSRPQPADAPVIVVFQAVGQEDLQSMLSIRDLLMDVRILMVLPDKEKETIAKAHRLRPRFITYADSDFIEIGAVLNKMCGIH